MIDQARQNLAGTHGRVELADIEQFITEPGSLDLITARLCLLYVAELDHIMNFVVRRLGPGGRFIFTVMHPVITSFDNRSTDPRTSWTVDDYFSAGPRVRSWLGSDVTWHHPTIENYVQAVIGAGLTLTTLRECEPRPERLIGHPEELARRQRVPLFLLLNASV